MPTATRFDTIPPAGLFEPEHDELRSVVRTFVRRAIAPFVEDWERAGELPLRDLFRQAGEVGIFGAKYPETYGGTDLGVVADAVITEELARCGSGGVAAALGAQKDLALLYLDRFGTEEQKRRYLAPGIAGDLVGALAVTEPDAGTDVAAIRTRAIREGDGWRLTGTKTFITNGPIADFVIVAASTDPPSGAKGISQFVIDAGTPGFVGRRIETVGWRTSHTGELVFEDCPLPLDALLGVEGEGFGQIMASFVWERLVMALSAVVGAEASLQMGMAYAREREAFGRPVARFQVWRHRFADLATDIEAARSLAYHALRCVAAGEPSTREVSMAKWFATELSWRVADEALQVHGGYGYMDEFPVQRAWRDARLGPIGGGTTEILKELIGRSYGL